MPSFAADYPRPLLQALGIQLCLLVLMSLILDGGMVFAACRYTSVGFWFGVILILIRRPLRPADSDLLYLRFGLPIIIVVAVPMFLWVWQIKNVI